jgi:hypothetical protein
MHLQQAGIVALDLSELDEPGIKAEWYMDEVHLDAAGNQAIAQIIANKIVADGLLRYGAYAAEISMDICTPNTLPDWRSD